jgi:hypothetical protein
MNFWKYGNFNIFEKTVKLKVCSQGIWEQIKADSAVILYGHETSYLPCMNIKSNVQLCDYEWAWNLVSCCEGRKWTGDENEIWGE